MLTSVYWGLEIDRKQFTGERPLLGNAKILGSEGIARSCIWKSWAGITLVLFGLHLLNLGLLVLGNSFEHLFAVLGGTLITM